MKNRRLVLMLKKVSQEELNSFEDFVKSPYFNKDKKAILLLEHILSFSPSFDDDAFTVENAETTVFGKLPPKGGLTKLISYLAKLGEQFVFIDEYKEDPFAAKFAIANFAFVKKEDKLYERSIRDLKKILIKKAKPDIRFYYEYYQYEELLSNYNFVRNPLLFNKNIAPTIEMLDVFFLSTRLRLAVGQLTQKNITQKEQVGGVMEYVLAFIEEKLQELPDLVKIWYKAFQLVNNPASEEAYTDLREEFSNSISDLSPKEAYGIFSILQNYQATAILSQGKRILEMFFLYKLGLEHKLLHAEGYILPGLFNNIVTVSLRLNELVWAENFISQYKTHLSQEHRENVVQYNSARLAFEKQDFRLCKRLLNQLDFQNTFVTLGIKRMQLKVYFELWEEELLENSLNAFRVYLHRLKKLAINHKEANLNFLNAVSSLSKFYHKAPTDDEKEVFITELAVQSNLHEQQWLIRKTGEF